MAALPPERMQALQALATELSRIATHAVSERDLLNNVLSLLISSTQSLGGALWLIAQKKDREITFRLGSSAAIEEAAGPPDSQQRQQVLRAASEVTLSSQPLVLMPVAPGQEVATPGVLINLGPHAIVGVPVRSGDDHLAVLQLWFPKESDSQKLAELALMLQALMVELGPRLRSRQLRELGAQSQRQQRLLQMASDLAGQLDPTNTAKLAAAHARELLGINRVSILVRKGDRWRLIAISGQESVEQRGTLVTNMVRFVKGHAHHLPWVVASSAGVSPASSSTGVPPVASPGVSPTQEIPQPPDPYFEETQMQSAALVPLREGPEGRTVGAMLCESTEAATFGPPGAPGDPRPPALVMAQWLADLAGKALSAALAHHSAPMVATLTKLGHWGDDVTATKKRRWLLWLGLTAAIVLVGLVWPLKDKVEADCMLLPLQRALITAETPSRIEEVLVREGDHITKNQIVARLDTRRLQSDLESAQQASKRLQAEAERQRGQGKEALARIASIEAQAAEETEKRLRLEIEFALLRAPMDGLVMTKDVHLKNGTFLQAGEALMELASTETWDLRLEVRESELSLLEEGLTAHAPREVHYLLYTQSARQLTALIENKNQISPALKAGKDGGVFSVTLPHVVIPADLQPLMRPGLTGRAKIELDRRPAGGVLLRNFIRWLRMRWWI